MTHKGTVLLESKRLILRRFKMEDLEEIYTNCWSDPEVWKWTNYKPMRCIEDVINIAGMFTDQWLKVENKWKFTCVSLIFEKVPFVYKNGCKIKQNKAKYNKSEPSHKTAKTTV